MMSIKILKNTIQMKNEKYWLHLMIWLLICFIIKKLNPIVIESFTWGRNLNFSLAFITESYFAVPKDLRLNSTHYFVMKIAQNESFNKLHLIIHQILIFKTLWIFIKNILQNQILFWWLTLLLHQIILHVSERIF